jgi:hypothetical protein
METPLPLRNLILLFGDQLYKTIVDETRPTNEEGYLLISDIPHRVSLFNANFTIQQRQSNVGVLSDRQFSDVGIALDADVRRVP